MRKHNSAGWSPFSAFTLGPSFHSSAAFLLEHLSAYREVAGEAEAIVRQLGWPTNLMASRQWFAVVELREWFDANPTTDEIASAAFEHGLFEPHPLTALRCLDLGIVTANPLSNNPSFVVFHEDVPRASEGYEREFLMFAPRDDGRGFALGVRRGGSAANPNWVLSDRVLFQIA